MNEYPADISTFRTRNNLPNQPFDEAKTTTIYNEDFLQIEQELMAVEEVIGTEPLNGYANLKSRLAEYDIYNLIDNGSFLTSVGATGDAWFVFNSTVGLEYLPPTDNTPDNKALRITPTDTYGGIGSVYERPAYNFPVAGSQFNLTIRYKSGGTGGDLVVNFQENGGDFTNFGSIVLDSTTWVTETVPCTVPSGHGTDNSQATSVVIINNGGAVGKYVDVDWIALTPASQAIPIKCPVNFRAVRTI